MIMAFIIFFFALILGAFPRKLKKSDDESANPAEGGRAVNVNSSSLVIYGSNCSESTFQEETKGRKRECNTGVIYTVLLSNLDRSERLGFQAGARPTVAQPGADLLVRQQRVHDPWVGGLLHMAAEIFRARIPHQQVTGCHVFWYVPLSDCCAMIDKALPRISQGFPAT